MQNEELLFASSVQQFTEGNVLRRTEMPAQRKAFLGGGPAAFRFKRARGCLLKSAGMESQDRCDLSVLSVQGSRVYRKKAWSRASADRWA